VSKQTIPHFYIRGSAQVSDLLELRARLNDSSSVKISVNDFIIKAAARAHELVPDMNVVWTEDSVQKMLSVDLGVAIATPSGLLTPVLRGVERMPISVAAEKCRDLAERAREGRLHQHELEGGTSTVTNLGMYGTEEFAAIINPPQSSILAVGAVRSEPVVTKKGTVRVRPMIRVTLSVDHRPIDGVVAAQWMHSFLEVLEQPLLLLSEGFSRSNAP
jgi:pyruvate dehydrogenase E2 component (dihydrolipoamide acetyltransferase)